MGSFATLSGNGYLHKDIKIRGMGWKMLPRVASLTCRIESLCQSSEGWLAIAKYIADSRPFNTPGARVFQKIREVIVKQGY